MRPSPTGFLHEIGGPFHTGKFDVRQVAKEMFVSVTEFGAKGDGVTDDSGAILAAAEQAESFGIDFTVGIYFPPGEYRAGEVDLSGLGVAKIYLFGAHSRSARISYNGPGGAGSYLIKLPGMSFGGIKDLNLFAWHIGGGEIAENLVVTTSYWDLLARIDGVQFHGSFGAAIKTTNNVNWQMTRCRWDGVGGPGIELTGSVSHENRPIVMRWVTFDNNISGARATQAQSDGYYDGTHWGGGIAKFDNGTGQFFKLEDSRIEMNKPVNADGLITEENTSSGQRLTVRLDNVVGYAAATGTDKHIPILHSDTGRYDLSLYRCKIGRLRGVAYNASSGTYEGSGEYDTEQLVGRWGGSVQRPRGILLPHDKRIESGRNSDLSTNFSFFNRGDILLRPASEYSPGSNEVFRVMAQPSSGHARPNAGTITTTAAVTSGNTTIDNVAVQTLLPDAAVTVVGAGAAGVDLQTRVAAVDLAAETIVIADSPSTSVDPATIKYQAPVWRDVGGEYGTAAPTSGTYAKGERRWNSSPAAGTPLGWVCITAGTPGTWVEFGHPTNSPFVSASKWETGA